MAEVTALRNNALPYPVYGLPYSIVVPVLDADGDPVSSAAGLDSEVSLNGDTPADCTNEATEIGSSGQYYLSLTAAEMTADIVSGVTKTSSTGAKTTCWNLYPRKLPQLVTDTAQDGAAGTITLHTGASALNDAYNGCVIYISSGTGNGQVRVISDYVGSTKVASVSPNWATNPSSDSVFKIYIPEHMQTVIANVTAVSDDATAADNCESFFDGTGYAGGTIKLGVDAVAISGDTTAADNCESFFDGTGYAGGTAKLSVLLADGAHGGAATTLTFKQIVGANSDAGESVISLTATGSGNSHGLLINSTNAKAIALGSTNSNAVSIDAPSGTGLVITGGTADITADINGTIGLTADAAGDIWDAAKADHDAAGSFGELLDVAVSTVGGGSLTVNDIVTGTWGAASRTLTSEQDDSGFANSANISLIVKAWRARR